MFCLRSSGYGAHDIGWKRASELSDDPHLFVGGATRFDINQVHFWGVDHLWRHIYYLSFCLQFTYKDIHVLSQNPCPNSTHNAIWILLCPNWIRLARMWLLFLVRLKNLKHISTINTAKRVNKIKTQIKIQNFGPSHTH